MNEIIATSTDGQYRVVASTEFEAESPRWGAEFGLMYAAHPHYTLGDQQVGVLAEMRGILADEGPEAVVQWLREEHGTTVILPLYLTDHSGLSIRAGANLLAPGGLEGLHGGGWDTSLVGAIFDTAENRNPDWVGDTEAILRAEVEEYDLYLQGRVYVLSVEQKVQEVRRSAHTYPDKVVMEDSVHERWEPVEDHGVTILYGEKDHANVAAEMLHEFETPVPNVVVHSE